MTQIRLPRPSADQMLQSPIGRIYLFRFLASLNLWLPIWVVYLQKERGLTIAQITALDAPFWLVMLLAQVPTGAFADRFGRRPSLVAGSLVLAVAYVVFGLAESYPLILLSYIAWAIGMAFQSGADLALLYDELASKGRSNDYQRAAGRANASMSLAAVLALLTGARLASATSLNVPVVASGAISLLAAAIALTIPEPVRHAEQRNGFLTTVRQGAATAWKTRELRYVLAYSAVIGAAMLIPVIFVQPFLSRYGFAVSNFGVLQAPSRVCSIVAALVAYRIARKLSVSAIFLALPVWFGAWFCLLAAWHAPAAYIAFPLLTLGFSGSLPLFSDYVNRHIPTSQRATVLSISELLQALLLIVLEPALGAIASSFGLLSAFWASAGFVAVGSTVCLVPWVIERRHRSPTEVCALEPV